MRKYSMDRARANEFGGTMQTSARELDERLRIEPLGSTTAESTLGRS